jgi:hypothetical protein
MARTEGQGETMEKTAKKDLRYQPLYTRTFYDGPAISDPGIHHH